MLLLVPALDHANVTDWDTMVEQLRLGMVPFLGRGTMDPTRSLNWMLIGYSTWAQEYPSNTQLFTNATGSKFFPSKTCTEAAKCRLCLQSVPLYCKTRMIQFAFLKRISFFVCRMSTF